MKILIALVLSLGTISSSEGSVNENFYQLDYRERLSVEASVPNLAGIEVTTSFEVRYRPKKKTDKKKGRTKLPRSQIF